MHNFLESPVLLSLSGRPSLYSMALHGVADEANWAWSLARLTPSKVQSPPRPVIRGNRVIPLRKGRLLLYQLCLPRNQCYVRLVTSCNFQCLSSAVR